MKNSDDALQKFINGRIQPDLQQFYPQIVAAYKSAWYAALRWSETNAGATDRNGERDSGLVERRAVTVLDPS